MTITITGNLTADDKIRRYVTRIIRSVSKYLPRDAQVAPTVRASLDTVNRPHGNKYEVTLAIQYGETVYSVTESTLNVFAALDIARLSLVHELQKPRH